MYLDQRGAVRSCCMNYFQVLGNVTERSLLAIWHGAAAVELRRAMEVGDLSLGCQFCQCQADAGRPDLAFARSFDQFAPRSAESRAWPRQLELSLGNTCNLQCVMCNGEWSSSIRRHREHKAPLPKVYDDAFFADLRLFLPHLNRVKFYGGEPFLMPETLRVMGLLTEAGLRTRCHVTTNGTVWSDRVERLLHQLPVGIALSLDAATEDTYRTIRLGAEWSSVMANLDRFHQYAKQAGTDLVLTFCLMTNNWWELLQLCRFGDERGLEVVVNTVTDPSPLSLYRLSIARLAPIVAELDHQERHQAGGLGLNRKAWVSELERLHKHLDEQHHPDTAPPMRQPVSRLPDPFTGVVVSTGAEPSTTGDDRQ